MKENLFKKFGVEPPVLLVALRIRPDWRDAIGSPDKNGVATQVLKGLLGAVLESDEIFVRSSVAAGYFNESIYIFELIDEKRAQTAVAVALQAIRNHVGGGSDYFVGVCDASGEPIHGGSHGLELSPRELCETAIAAQEEVVRVKTAFIQRKQDELEGGEDWKKGSAE